MMNDHPFWQTVGMLMLLAAFVIGIVGAGLGIWRMFHPKPKRYEARIESDLIASRCDLERIKEGAFIAACLGAAFILAMAFPG